MDKKTVLDNVSNLSVEQLFEVVSQGLVTLPELQQTGDLDVNKRKTLAGLISKHEEEQKALNAQKEKQENEAWERAQYGNEFMLSDFIAQFPNSRYVYQAQERIRTLDAQRKQAQAGKQRILEDLSANPSAYTPGEVKEFLEKGTLTHSDLLEVGIPQDVLDILPNLQPPRLSIGNPPEFIPDGYTEVYFWGVPGSGKTAALGAILNTAEKLGLLEIATGPGYNYMTQVKNMFHDKRPILSDSTTNEVTQYLPFTLNKSGEKPRSVSLIELSGEVFQCFYYKNANLPYPSSQHEKTLNTLIKFLNGRNRKIHFFFIDYEKENHKDREGFTQADYLNAASTFFKNNQIFRNTTDAIYIVLTKADLMPCNREEWIPFAISHLQNNFRSFIETIKTRCKEHSINNGRLFVEPFSIGKVYFQRISKFDNTTAKRIIEILLERIQPSGKSVLDVFNK